MQADMLLVIAGIKGESTDTQYKDAIVVHEAHWGVSQNVSVQSGGMGCHGAGNLKELRVFKALDQASPTLRAQACIGMHYPTAVLVKRKAGQKPLEYFKLRMKDIVVASIDLTLGNGDSPDTEILTLKFAEFLEEYTPQSATGAARPTVSAGYNAALEKNCKTP